MLFGTVSQVSSPGGISNDRLLTPKHPLLPALAAYIPFETAIGLNGRVWFKAGSAGQTIALRRVIEAVDAGECGTERGEVEAKVKEFMA